MTKWAAEIEEDLRWREAELGSLKLAAAAAPDKSDRQRALLRALWTMLYAHYEGFFKFCWDLFLNEIERDGCIRDKAVEPVMLLSLSKTFQELRADTSSISIWDFAHGKLPIALKQPVSFASRLETKSNLWANLAKDNNMAVGLPTNEIDKNSAQINAIVGRRNDIAHGKKLVVGNLDDYSQYELAAMMVMHELAVAVVDQLDKRSFAIP
ncbi:MAG: MAE_28990/MAE_18760 family HEPN-like nuclease [Pseudomonadota bacterium]